jgi:hypothetical protein
MDESVGVGEVGEDEGVGEADEKTWEAGDDKGLDHLDQGLWFLDACLGLG